MQAFRRLSLRKTCRHLDTKSHVMFESSVILGTTSTINEVELEFTEIETKYSCHYQRKVWKVASF